MSLLANRYRGVFLSPYCAIAIAFYTRDMKTLVITKADLDKDNKYKEPEIGKWNDPADVSVEVEENLGYVRFDKGVYVKGSIVCKAGSGIKAGWGIKAGSGIEAGEGIVTFYSWVKARLAITINAKCAIAAGVMSLDGPQDVEASEINGNVAYGNKKIIPADSIEKRIVKVKTAAGDIAEGEMV